MSYTAFWKMLKFKLPTSQVIDYHDTESGFLLRGNSDLQHVRNAIEKSLNEMYDFLEEHKEKNPRDLVREGEGLGPEAHKKEGRSWGQYFQETGEEMKEGAKHTGERVGEGMKSTGERIGQGTRETGQRIEDQSKATGDRWKESAQRSPPRQSKDR